MIFFTYHLSFPSLVLTCPHEEIMSKCLAYYARILQSVKKDMVLSLSLSLCFFLRQKMKHRPAIDLEHTVLG